MSNRWTVWKSVVETVALVTIALAVVWTAANGRPLLSAPRATARSTTPPPPLPITPISLAGAQTAGSAKAKVALLVYSDFQCPFCAKFARESLPTLEKEYVESGKVLLAFRQYPLPMHAFAEKAAEGSLCAARQGKFWPFHDDLFANQHALDPASLEERAERLGLDPGQFTSCLRGETAEAVRTDQASARPLGISGTPAFLVGPLVGEGHLKVTERFSGALPIGQFQTVLDKVLIKAGVGAGGH